MSHLAFFICIWAVASCMHDTCLFNCNTIKRVRNILSWKDIHKVLPAAVFLSSTRSARGIIRINSTVRDFILVISFGGWKRAKQMSASLYFFIFFWTFWHLFVRLKVLYLILTFSQIALRKHFHPWAWHFFFSFFFFQKMFYSLNSICRCSHFFC